MSYDRLTSISYEEAVKRKLSPEYQRLALLEDAIQTNKLVYTDTLIDRLNSAKIYAESKNSSEEVAALLYAIKIIRRGA